MNARSGISRLYASERERISRLVQRIVGNRSTADDLTQDAFLNYLHSLERSAVERPEAYLRRSARNLALNHLRHVRMGVELPVEQQVYEALPDGRASPERQALVRQELRRLLAALAALPPRRREVFILSRFEQRSHGEIAAQLGLSRRTVINHIVNALEALDVALGADFLEL